MHVPRAATTSVYLTIWLGLCISLVISLSSDRQDGPRPVSEMSFKEQTKAFINCSLVVKNPGNVFQTNAIAISFVVTVCYNGENDTDHELRFSFVWVHKNRAKFLLALPDDSEILSITTLQHLVDTSSVHMVPPNVNQSGCFNKLTSLRQAEVIVAAFYETFHVPPGKPFCFPPLQLKNNSKTDKVIHQCCYKEADGCHINCTEAIYQNDWVAYGIVAVQAGCAILVLLCPLLFKYLPTRDIQVVRRSKGTMPRKLGNSNLPAMCVDSTTPSRKLLTLVEPLSFVTCGGDEAQACYSRLCRAIALFIFPAIVCVYVIGFFLNNHRVKIRSNVSYYTAFVGFLKPPVEYYLFAVVVFCLFLLGILVIIPGRLSGIGKALSGRKDEKTFLGFDKPEQFINQRSGKIGFQFLCANMMFHLKCCFDVGFWLFILKVIFSPCTCLLRSCVCIRPGYTTDLSSDPDQDNTPSTCCVVLGFILLPVTMALWTTFVLLSFLVYVTPVGYVAFRIGYLLYSKDVPFQFECCERLPGCIRVILVLFLYLLFISFCVCVLGSYIFVAVMFGLFFYILGKIFLYTLIGLGFNVEFYITYSVLAFFVLFYTWRAFHHYFSIYENLRVVLFEECEKYEQQELLNGQTNSTNSDLSPPDSRTRLLVLDNNNNPALPVNLFVATYRRLRPRGKTFFTVFVKLCLKFVYLSVAFASIMSLNESQGTSCYVQAGFLCVALALPLVIFHGSTAHSKRRRKELEYQVRFIIHRYVSKVAVNYEQNVGSPTGAVELPENDDLYEI